MLRCGTVQFHHQANDKTYNMGVVERFAREAAGQVVKILAFPEMCLTGYWHARRLDRAGCEDLSEPVPEGPSTQRLMPKSAEGSASIIGAGAGIRLGLLSLFAAFHYLVHPGQPDQALA